MKFQATSASEDSCDNEGIGDTSDCFLEAFEFTQVVSQLAEALPALTIGLEKLQSDVRKLNCRVDHLQAEASESLLTRTDNVG
mmetsp:Transcript_117972/g.184322  ORF Transcript_117972/g.184322 Transcript_117972/m.184322 type:complete len:83 (+) Transcript_117972:1-249(+)